MTRALPVLLACLALVSCGDTKDNRPDRASTGAGTTNASFVAAVKASNSALDAFLAAFKTCAPAQACASAERATAVKRLGASISEATGLAETSAPEACAKAFRRTADALDEQRDAAQTLGSGEDDIGAMNQATDHLGAGIDAINRGC